MVSNKKVALVSDDEELYLSIKRTLSAKADLKVVKYTGILKEKQSVVLYIIDDNNYDIDSWLWEEFRTKKRALNPLIIIGLENRDIFFTKKHPIFVDYPDEHAYVQIPFDLMGLINIIERLKPIYDHVTRKIIVSQYIKEYEFKLITHDLKIIKGNKQTTINNLLRVVDFYRAKEDSETVNIIIERIEEIKAMEDWEQEAVEIKEYLEDRLRARRSK